ncbi:MAG: hypothetical protein NTZ81_07485 [Actinobacteria bacterium]|nr:hypothetical protein [Actinomycetota bacterium]
MNNITIDPILIGSTSLRARNDLRGRNLVCLRICGTPNRNVGKPNEHQVGGLERDPGDQILGIDLPHQRDNAAHPAERVDTDEVQQPERSGEDRDPHGDAHDALRQRCWVEDVVFHLTELVHGDTKILGDATHCADHCRRGRPRRPRRATPRA